MKTTNSTPDIWLIAFAFTIIIPLLAGTLGCANQIGGLSQANISWILICSAIPMMLAGLINAIAIGIGRRYNRTNPQLVGILLLTSIPIFILTFQVVYDVSGV